MHRRFAARGRLGALALVALPIAGGAEAGAVVAAGEREAVEVPVSIRLSPQRPDLDLDRAVAAICRVMGGPGTARAVDLEPRAATSFSLPAGSFFELVITDERFWAPRLEGRVPNSGGPPPPFEVQIFARAGISGQLVDGPGAGPAETLSLRTEVPEERAGAVHFRPAIEPCALDASTRRFRCSAPAGRWDLALKAPGFAPEYLWGLELTRTRSADLGRIQLRPGASLAGSLRVEGAALSPERARLRLSPARAHGARTDPRIDRRTVETRPDGRGFFRFLDLEPGVFVLEASAADHAAVAVRGIEIRVGAETRLESPILLRHPLDLELSLVPPTDPLGFPWSARLLRASDLSAGFDERPVFDGTVEGGSIRVASQSPGRFALIVRDAAGNSFLSRRDLEISSPEEARQLIPIDFVDIQGTVELGGEPVETSLWFGGRRGSESVSFRSDERGFFQGALPREGRWLVELEGDGSFHQTWIRVRPKNGYARVHLEIPATRLAGEVVDEEGRRVPHARVRATDGETAATANTDESGSFSLRGLPPGRISIRAASEDASGNPSRSREQIHLLEEERPLEGLRLVVERSREIEGRLVSAVGPVAGATVWLRVLEPIDLAAVATAQSDVQGLYRAEVPARATRIEATVAAPGYALTVQELDAEDPGDLIVPREKGTVTLHYPGDDLVRGTFVLDQDGHDLSHQALAHWSSGHGEVPRRESDGWTWRIPGLAIGVYRLCWTDPQEALRRWLEVGTSGATGPCVAEFLAPQSEIRLEVAPAE